MLPPLLLSCSWFIIVQAPQCKSEERAATPTPEVPDVLTFGWGGISVPIKSIFASLSREVCRTLFKADGQIRTPKRKTIKEDATKPTPESQHTECPKRQAKLAWLDATAAFAVCQHGNDDIGPDVPSVLGTRPNSPYGYMPHAPTAGAATRFLVAAAQRSASCRRCSARMPFRVSGARRGSLFMWAVRIGCMLP